MDKKEPVASIMTKSVITADKNEHNLRDIVEMFRKEKIRHIPIMDKDELVGIISQNDINRLSFGSLFENQDNADETVLDMLTIDQVMSSKPIAVQPTTTIDHVARIIVEERFHSLPVVENNTIKGIVTSTDVINYFLQ